MPIKGSNLSNPLKSHDIKGNPTPKYSEIRQINRSTSKGWGTESLNSLHKLTISENLFISTFGGMKMYKKCPKAIKSVNLYQF